MSKVIVVGGGPAGMFAAIAAAENGHETILLEKNEKLGKKLYITGKGRCNLTNAGDMESLFAGVTTNPRFLYSAFYAYDNSRVTAFFEENGLPLKTERGNRVFPFSDHSSDVIAVLRRVLAQRGVTVRLHTGVAGLLTAPYAKPAESPESGGSGQMIRKCREDDSDVRESGGRRRAPGKKITWQSAVRGVLLEDGTKLSADAVILATGGVSYPSTGSTGDGYRFAEDAGHTIVTPAPSLVPFYAKEDYVTSLQGLSLRNVRVRVRDGRKQLFDEFGELLFTHFGVSGPLMLSASAAIPRSLIQKQLSMEIDLKPALDAEQLDARLLREFERAKNRQFKNAVASLFPAKLTPVMLLLGGVDPEKRVNEITREERQTFARRVKAFPLTLAGPRGFDEAIITRGGVKTGEVNPSTMESKLVKHLYLCGELLDVDARTGGFNLQIAWSTGYLAGNSAGSSRTE
ncbi:MAG: NAD(P)/FAD-dependent oxidoreductase [Roseburia sp.]|jgi:predicted flavoprotein YhiN|nr:NAD(P)/FAD-dependent oxidoreductase [Roseburia sp.]